MRCFILLFLIGIVYAKCNSYLYSDVGVISPGNYASIEFYRNDIFAGIITFHYDNSKVKGYFYVLLNIPSPRPEKVTLSISSTPNDNSSYPISINIPEDEQEFESKWLKPNKCSPSPCTQTLYIHARMKYCPDTTSSPTGDTPPPFSNE